MCPERARLAARPFRRRVPLHLPGRHFSHPSPTIEERAIATAISLKQTTKRPGIERHDTVAAAARKTLRFHFARMLKHEAGSIDGSDIEELHDMRVAVRRLRAAVQLFRPYLPKQAAAYLRKDLRRLGRVLGPARDYDVMLANLAAYRAEAPAHAPAAFAPLAQRWHKQRARARKAMLAYLAGKRYRLLKQRIEPMLAGEPPAAVPRGPGNGQFPEAVVPPGPLVATEVPGLLSRRYEKLFDYGPSLHGASVEELHALRIDCKRLRYALEFLRETLPAPAEAAIDDIKHAQDHLGDMNDAYVAGALLRKILKKWQREADDARYPAAARSALSGYLAYCDDRVRTHARTFPSIWESLTGYEFRQRLQAIMTTPP